MEKELVDQFVGKFGNFFDIKREVWDDSHKNRIDMVLSLKNNNYIKFGIEAKYHDKKRGSEVGKTILQANRYSVSTFDGDRLIILLIPSISRNVFETIDKDLYYNYNNQSYYKIRHTEGCTHHTFNGFLGALNIGEVIKINNSDTAFIFSNYTLWSILGGLHLTNYNKINQSIKSWSW